MEKLSLEQINPSIPSIQVNIRNTVVAANSTASKIHAHKEIELMYILGGSMQWNFPNQTIVASKGDCVFVNSFTPHSTYSLEDSSYMVIQFPRDKLFSASANLNNNLSNFINDVNHPFYTFSSADPKSQPVLRHVEEIHFHQKFADKCHQMFIYASCINIMGILMKYGFIEEDDFSNRKAEIKKILPITDYIEANFKQNLSLDELSLHSGFNSIYLCRIFKKATGKTITDYINFIRIQNCLELLRDPETSITQVALSCGFSNIPHFNTTFKKQIGCSPSAYRKTTL